MRKIPAFILTSLALTVVLTGCGTPLAPSASNPGSEIAEKALSPAQKASGVALETSMQATIQQLEVQRAAGQPLQAPELPAMGEEVIVSPSADGTQYCLHMVNAEADVSKTYFSSEGKIRDGGTCDNFS